MSVARNRVGTVPGPSKMRSLRWRLLGLLTLATAPVAVLMIAQATSEYSRDRNELERSLLQIAEIAASEERDIIVGAKQVLLALASQPAVVTMRQPACDQALHNVFFGLQTFENIAVFDVSGHPVCSEKTIPSGANVAGRGWFEEVLAGEEFVVSDLVVNVITRRRVIVAAVPLRDEEGQLVGVLNTTIGTGWLTWLSRLSGPVELTFSALIDSNGEPLDWAQLQPEDLAEFPPATKITSALRDDAHVFLSAGRDGIARAYAATPLVADRLYLLIGREEAELFGWARFDLVAGLFFPVAIWLGALLCIWIGIQRLVLRWLTYLGRIAIAYGAGQYDTRTDQIEQAPDEFRRLGRIMAEMASGIEKRTDDLKQTLEEKNWLIREVHHRVKNNLQIVSSLFNIQLQRITEPHVRAVFADAQSRLNALELVHRTLYEATNLKEINLRLFLSELVSQLMKSHPSRKRNVVLQHNLPDAWVNPDKAIPMGLLVTEVVTNSLKHGFPDDRGGRIEIRLDLSSNGAGELIIKDNGIGEETNVPGFGSQLIAAFAKQLGGKSEITFGSGATMTVVIPKLLDVAPSQAA